MYVCIDLKKVAQVCENCISVTLKTTKISQTTYKNKIPCIGLTKPWIAEVKHATGHRQLFIKKFITNTY